MHEHLRPLEFGEILDYTFRLYRRKFFLFFGLLFLIYVPLQLLYTFASSFYSLNRWLSPAYFTPSGEAELFLLLAPTIIPLAYLLLVLILHPLAQGGVIKAVDATLSGREAGLFEMYGEVFKHARWLKLIAVGLIGGLAIFLAMLPCFVPGILLGLKLILLSQIVMLEDGGVSAAFSRSWFLTANQMGRTFLVMLVAYLLQFVVSFIINLPATVITYIFMFLEINPAWLTAAQVFSAVFSVLAMPIPMIATTVLYYDLRARQEGYDLETRMLQSESAPDRVE